MKNFLNKFKDTLLYLVKGIAIGIAMIIPGVSGGTLAVLLNIYDDMINAINNLFKDFKNSIKTLIPIVLGALLGFVALIFPISYGLEKCPLVIISLFAGLIIGGIPQLYKKVQGKESILGVIIGIISIGIMVGLCFITSDIKIDFQSLDLGLWLYLLLGGILAAIALVVPGISGSMILMILGLYAPILIVLSDLLKFQNIISNIMIFIPIGLGIILGFFSIAKLMGFLLKKQPINTYFSIIGFVVGSIFTIYYVTITDSDYFIDFSFPSILISVICLIGGFLLTFLLEKKITKFAKEEEKNEIR